MSNLRESIRKTLSSSLDENTKKQVTISLDTKVIEKVDRIAKEFSKISDKNFSRNTIVELAISEYIKESATIL